MGSVVRVWVWVRVAATGAVGWVWHRKVKSAGSLPAVVQLRWQAVADRSRESTTRNARARTVTVAGVRAAATGAWARVLASTVDARQGDGGGEGAGGDGGGDGGGGGLGGGDGGDGGDGGGVDGDDEGGGGVCDGGPRWRWAWWRRGRR